VFLLVPSKGADATQQLAFEIVLGAVMTLLALYLWPSRWCSLLHLILWLAWIWL